MPLAGVLVTRYTKSSQAALQLAECYAVLDVTSLKVAQNVEARWCSTQGLVKRMMYLKEAIELFERLYSIASLLSLVYSVSCDFC